VTHGTVLIIGGNQREIELLSARMEREHYAVIHVRTEGKINKALKEQKPQAVLISSSLSKPLIERIISQVTVFAKGKSLPTILLADTEVPEPLYGLKGVGEVFRLHTIPLATAMRRLNLAIRLCQVANP
jgi:DNA-binding response OmpR family regulator